MFDIAESLDEISNRETDKNLNEKTNQSIEGVSFFSEQNKKPYFAKKNKVAPAQIVNFSQVDIELG